MCDEAEFDVLEPRETDWKDIPVQAAIRTVRVPVQQIVINNELRTEYGAAVALVCPKCNGVLQQFRPGVPEVEVAKALCTDDQEALGKSLYCRSCGQLLRIMRPAPVDAECCESEGEEKGS